jgi:S-adenosyl-L-methionine hydrolase (adenosine-forming)
MPLGIITLLTDFGLEDPYVGIMKGVILGLNPAVAIVDLTHQIKRGDIHQAAHVLQQSSSFFPSGAIHVAVVDPGVGTSRRPITVKSGAQFFVGPDNGLFWPVIKADPDAQIIHLTNETFFRPPVSHTFHGRDIFAPVAARLSMGTDPLKMGNLMGNPVSIPDNGPTREGDTLLGRVTRVDHFGNVITNIHREDLAPFLGNGQMVIRVKEERIKGVLKTYADGANGELIALLGSTDHLEIAVNSGRADHRLNLNEASGLPVVRVDRIPVSQKT